MSVAVAARSSNYKVIFDGQSLNLSGGVNCYPNKLMADRGIHYANVAISGFAWGQLKDILTTRVNPHFLRAPITIIIGVGGTTDYAFNATGATLYASEVAWATNCRAAGADYVIQTTTTPTTSFGTNTTVDTPSDNVNTSSFVAGSGTLYVVTTTNAAASGTIIVATNGTPATVTYTGKTITTFTGCTTISGGGVMNTGGTVRSQMNTNLYAGNALVMADASNAFDYSVDLAGDSRLSEPGNTTYYGDGTHPTDAGRQVMADLIAPALDAILANS